MDFLKALILVSEKAANIARLLRQNDRLFERLVEVKSGADANPRFQEDFKTLADVLIQEMVKHDIGLQFPSIANKIQGEESNRFINQTTNEEVLVEVKNTKKDTAQILSNILDDDEETADLLATEVHRSVNIEDVNTRIPDVDFDIDIDQLGIWIDPIDGTNEYVKGANERREGRFYLKGLKCVTVLIGVYDDEGQPVIGVVNQPFFEMDVDEGYSCHWGICSENNGDVIKLSTVCLGDDWSETKIICVGGSEDKSLLDILENAGYSLVVTRGAGYKLLTVVLGISDAYILSKPTTFLWDTCAPHAILRALGGGITEMKSIAEKRIVPILSYNGKSGRSRENSNGIIAYRNKRVLEKLIEIPWKNI